MADLTLSRKLSETIWNLVFARIKAGAEENTHDLFVEEARQVIQLTTALQDQGIELEDDDHDRTILHLNEKGCLYTETEEKSSGGGGYRGGGGGW